MRIIPTPSQKSQTLTAVLAGQNTRLNIYQLSTGMFIDVLVNDAPIVTGVICRVNTRIVRDAYLGFLGDLAWLDTEGAEDPNWTGIGARWVLGYLDA